MSKEDEKSDPDWIDPVNTTIIGHILIQDYDTKEILVKKRDVERKQNDQ